MMELHPYKLDGQCDFSALTMDDFKNRLLFAELYELDEFDRQFAEAGLRKRAKELGLNFNKLWKPLKAEFDGELRGAEKPAFTIEALRAELPALNISPSWDDISATICFGTGDRDERTTVPTRIYSALCDKYKGVNLKIVTAYLTNIALGNHVNPVLNFLNKKENCWDGKDRFEELYQILGIENDAFSQTLVYKWFWQGLTMAKNGRGNARPEGADGMLVLSGPQGIGKTSFFRWAACNADWFRDGCILSRDKDDARRVVTCWIAELGEIGRTLRGDIDSLKAFVTRPLDEYRLPYGLTDIQNPRHTNLCGTVNGNDGFLIDDTGNRRFWTVSVDYIDLEALHNLDAAQVWAQVHSEGARANPQGFRLTAEEREELERRNSSRHMKKRRGYEEVFDLISDGKDWEWETLTNWKCRFESIRGLSTRALSQALTQISPEYADGGKYRKSSKNSVPGRYFWLPMC